ncbi:UDP-N-acetylmuramoyl-tripeptide--D-alanyl-D-alanine ligase [soil metagenome]
MTELHPRLDMTTLRRVFAERLGVHLADDAGFEAATGLAFHDRLVRPGDVFFALPGGHGHGIAHADAALERGAAFVVSDRPHARGVVVPDPAAALLALGHEARAAWSGPIVGISGSVGKTTMKALLAAAIGAHASPGNRNTPLALACTLVEAWLSDDVERPLVLELGIDHVGEMDRLVDLVRPTHGLLTTIDLAHLDGLGDLEGVTREKGRLLHAATQGRYAGSGAWARLDDELRSRTTQYALAASQPPSGTYATNETGATLEARIHPDDAPVRLTLPGLGSAIAEHALGALRVARDLGVDVGLAAARIEAASIEGRRLEAKRIGDLTVIDDTYNASPTSMRLALTVLRDMPLPHAAVLGDMRELGAHAEGHHDTLASLTKGVPTLWGVGPLSERVVRSHPNARHYPDVSAALADVDALPKHGTLLVKGSRGIELERLVDALVARRDSDGSSTAAGSDDGARDAVVAR